MNHFTRKINMQRIKDWLLELRIYYLRCRVEASTTKARRLANWYAMIDCINQRSASQVARMESERGLSQ